MTTQKCPKLAPPVHLLCYNTYVSGCNLESLSPSPIPTFYPAISTQRKLKSRVKNCNTRNPTNISTISSHIPPPNTPTTNMALALRLNTSLETCASPKAFKTAVVKLLLKKSNLDRNSLSNYRPISNLPFMGKILEKVVFNQLNTFLNENSI